MDDWYDSRRRERAKRRRRSLRRHKRRLAGEAFNSAFFAVIPSVFGALIGWNIMARNSDFGHGADMALLPFIAAVFGLLMMILGLLFRRFDEALEDLVLYGWANTFFFAFLGILTVEGVNNWGWGDNIRMVAFVPHMWGALLGLGFWQYKYHQAKAVSPLLN